MKQLDIIVWGASSFVGKLIVEQLWQHYGDSLAIAIAGRDELKLAKVNQAHCGGRAKTLVGDAHDAEFLTEMTKQTKLVISTVGPYALYGEALVKACVEQGIDYCDLTGEPQWIWQMQQSYAEQAKTNGARIMHCCGFDSIPSDLGVLALQNYAKQERNSHCQQIHYRFLKSHGGFSGGTVASMLNAIKQIRQDRAKARVLKTPYALLDHPDPDLPYQKSVKGLERSADGKHYLLPFIMASINTKVVHKTNALLGYPWGKSFLYDESMAFPASTKGGFKAAVTMAGLTLFGLFAAFSPSRRLLEKYIVPKPGEGPSEEDIKHGFFKLELKGQLADGNELVLTMTGQGDPGYGSTCKMITQTATLLLETPKQSTGVGFITPAAALGQPLLQRLQDKADINIKYQ